MWKERINRVNSRLKSCPCCGGNAEIKERYRTDEHYTYKVEYVVCSQCGLMTKELITNGYYDEPFVDTGMRAKLTVKQWQPIGIAE